jgi:hypothetical protein
MKNLNNPLQVEISGTLIGTIWMPSTICTKEFRMNLTIERNRFTDKSLSISEAIQRVCNDGDFQSCSIAEATLKITYWIGNKTIGKYFDISRCKSIKDHWMNKKEKKAFENIDCNY